MIKFERINRLKLILSKARLFLFKGNFFKLGKKSTILGSFRIKGAKYISIGNKVFIHDGSWIEALAAQPCLFIGNGTYIGRMSHIISLKSITIGDNVLIADKVYISDNSHEYQDINIPIKMQPIKLIREVVIGDNSWIGENVSIIGANIGKHSIVAANSVVTKDIPDYCIGAGVPAKIIKRYDFSKQKWVKYP